MIAAQARNAYRRSETQGKTIPPEKLIHLLYERALKHLCLAEEGIEEKDTQKRGENVGKAIAFVTELNASLDMQKGGETAAFLRGLYEALLCSICTASKATRDSQRHSFQPDTHAGDTGVPIEAPTPQDTFFLLFSGDNMPSLIQTPTAPSLPALWRLEAGISAR